MKLNIVILLITMELFMKTVGVFGCFVKPVLAIFQSIELEECKNGLVDKCLI